MEESLNWPPHYILKTHAQARHVKFKTSRQRGLEIIIPKKFNLKYLPELLEKNKKWISTQLQKLEDFDKEHLPLQIHFQAFATKANVVYLKTKSKTQLFVRPSNELVLVGDTENIEVCQLHLKLWLKKFAEIKLKQLLLEVSLQTQLSYSQLIIRDQQTRWGSCTSEKKISLNIKLVFLPLRLTRYIIIHELCHTKFLNHSVKFWRLVESIDPDYKLHRKELRAADQYIPHWAL